MLVAIDFLAVMLAGLLSDRLSHGVSERLTNHIAGSGIAAIAVLVANAQCKLYDVTLVKRPDLTLERVSLATIGAFGALAFITWLAGLPAANPSIWKIGVFVLSTVLVASGRLLFGLAFVKFSGSRLVSRNAVIVGAGAQGAMLAIQLERDVGSSMRVLAIFDDRAHDPNGRVPRRLLGRYSVLGTTAKLAAFARRVRVDEIFIALPWTSEQRIHEILAALSVIPANVHLCPDVLRDWHVLDRLTSLDGMTVVTLASRSAGWARLSRWLSGASRQQF